MKASSWHWVHGPGGVKYHGVGITETGELINPHGYPEADVRAAIAAAVERRTERRKAAAAQGAQTRKRRRDLRIHEIAQHIVAGRMYGPRSRCYLCRHRLTDADSIERGIGTECWEAVLESIEAQLTGAPEVA
jgi:Family of unknown function (DUF6011)